MGLLGHLIAESDSNKHRDGTMSLQVDDVVATGAIRFAVGPSDRKGREPVCIFFEVRTFLPVSEMENRAAMLDQGRVAMGVLRKWVESKRDDAIVTDLVNTIPFLPKRGDDFIMQRAIKG